MRIIAFLLGSSRVLVVATVLASFLSGALGAVLIALVNRVIVEDDRAGAQLALVFGVVVLVKLGTHFASQVMLVRFAQDAVLRLCRGLCASILRAPYVKLEAMGAPRLLATLNDDVAVLGAAVQAIPPMGTNVAVVIGCAVYLAWLSLPLFAVSALMVLIGVAGYRLLLKRAHRAIEAARGGRDQLFGNFRTLIEGVRELQLHRARRVAFVRHEIDETTDFLRRQNVVAMSQYMAADVWTQLLFFALISMLLFGAGTLADVPKETVVSYVFAALYMMNPAWGLVHTVPVFMRGRVALDRIRELGATLGPGISDAVTRADPVPGREVRIGFEGVTYAYPAPPGEERGFVLGPLNLELRSGETIFVTGGNGSGKSTLVKLLTGLYEPHKGQIRLNGEPVDEARREGYRQHFTAIFSDFHLFDRLFGLDAHGREPEIRRYLEMLRLSDKVEVRGDRFSTTALSTGQRKRLALLTAYLEDRPVYIFDEWAADQDPTYKDVFYRTLLPELRQRGKCVVVITHDDRYFHLGDRVLKLDGGHVMPQEPVDTHVH